MTYKTIAVHNADQTADVALQDEIKCRAYQLYEQRTTLDGDNPEDVLTGELHRVAYAAAELQKFAKGEIGDSRTVRAARVYLIALSAFIGERDRV